MIIVSSCLLGMNCKYNGSSNEDNNIKLLMKDEILIPVCPEQMGGLETPREPSEIKIVNGKTKVIDKKGKDVTSQFQKGAEETLKIAKLYNVDTAILKSRSPSCGSCKIYDGTFSGKVIQGEGITAALLRENHIKIYSEINCLGKLK